MPAKVPFIVAELGPEQVNIYFEIDLQISCQGHCNALAVANDLVMPTKVFSNCAPFKQQNAIEVLQIKRIMQAHDDGLSTKLGSFGNCLVETRPCLDIAVCHRLIEDPDKDIRIQKAVKRPRKRPVEKPRPPGQSSPIHVSIPLDKSITTSSAPEYTSAVPIRSLSISVPTCPVSARAISILGSLRSWVVTTT
jgi:hypothetical protein